MSTGNCPTEISTNSEIVTITMNHGWAILSAEFEPLLRDVLSSPKTVFDRVGSRVGHRSENHVRYERRDDATLVVLEGCVPRLCECLNRHGKRVKVIDNRPMIPIQINDAAGIEAGSLGAAILRHRSGLLEVPRQSRIRVVAALVRSLPQARILIVFDTVEEVDQFAIQLSAEAGCYVGRAHLRKWSSSNRIVCLTYASLDSSYHSDWDVVICADARKTLSRLAIRSLAFFAARGQRRYAIIENQSQVTPRFALDYECLFGRTIWHAHGGRHTPRIQVEFASMVPRAEQTPRDRRENRSRSRSRKISLSARELRETYWRNELVNSTIASVATALVSKDVAKLGEFGVFVGEVDPFAARPAMLRVAVVVESTRQAQELATRLPGWEVRSAVPKASGDSTSPDIQPLPRLSIVTQVEVDRHRTFEADVVVMALRGTQAFLPGSIRRQRDVTIIDVVDDETQPDSARESRRHSYASLGGIVATSGAQQEYRREAARTARRSSQLG